jgi:hypothetical protein
MLKDELRPVAKVIAGKTRLISGAPLAYVIVWRMYFMAFTASVQRHRISNGIAIGINPYKEWPVLVSKFKTVSRAKNMLAGDYSMFDASELPQVHREIVRNINAWYLDGDENQLIRQVLYAEVYSSYHLGGLGPVRNEVYHWNRSLPSGHPATSVLNSFYNLTIIALVYHKVMAGCSLSFWDNVAPIVFGDDNTMAVSDAVEPLFNQITLEQHCPSFGVAYTPENKVGSSVNRKRPLSEVTFLKRGFREEGGTYLAPLDLDSVLYRCYWTRDRNDSHVPENLCDTLTELSLHPLKTWRQWAEKMVVACRDKGHQIEEDIDYAAFRERASQLEREY